MKKSYHSMLEAARAVSTTLGMLMGFEPEAATFFIRFTPSMEAASLGAHLVRSVAWQGGERKRTCTGSGRDFAGRGARQIVWLAVRPGSDPTITADGRRTCRATSLLTCLNVFG